MAGMNTGMLCLWVRDVRPFREDGRVNHVEITPEGKAVVGQSLRLFEEADELLFAGFGDDEVEALAALLSRAKENLEREEARQREPDGGK